MREYIGKLKLGLQEGIEVEFEVPDNATDDEIESIAREAVFDQIDWWYEEKDKEKA